MLGMGSATVPIVLSIAGFDPSSGAGITADIKTCAALSCYGVGAITALTVQNTSGVAQVKVTDVGIFRDTLQCLAEDTRFAAIKVGMLGSAEIVAEVLEFLKGQGSCPVVLDPVLRSSSGTELLSPAGINLLKGRLLPLMNVVTPNMDEAALLTGIPVRSLDDMKKAAERLQEMGAKTVVVTGGHLPENIDLLRLESGEELEISGARVDSRATHGTGCAFSTVVTCELAHGRPMKEAVNSAKEYVRQAIKEAYSVGKGFGPLNHLFGLKR